MDRLRFSEMQVKERRASALKASKAAAAARSKKARQKRNALASNG